jgi:alpha-L-fucosidase 2
VIWDERAATNWNEALPVGHGRISAMIFGGANQERLQRNEGSLWGARKMVHVDIGGSCA